MESVKKPMDDIVNFFTSNPFSTPVGQKIEEATSPALPSEDWALNLEICDLINAVGSDPTATVPRDAVRAIRKRLTQGSKGTNQGQGHQLMLTLTVLETCVKNCGPPFHSLVMTKEFIGELVKLIAPKMELPLVVQEKVLGLIEVWAEAFGTVGGVKEVYDELKGKGVEFPGIDLGDSVPIFMPPKKQQPQQLQQQQQQRSVEDEGVRSSSGGGGDSTNSSSQSPILHQVDLGEERQIKPSPDQLSKLRRDLDLAQGNLTVFAELLNELKPGEEERGDLELVQELYTSCKEIQRRIGDLLCTISNDELIAEMLHVNDELNHLFLRYGRYRKNVEKTGASAAAAAGAPTQQQSQGPPAADEPSLIDWGTPAPAPPDVLAGKMGNLGLSSNSAIGKGTTTPATTGDTDFDMFAQSRGATYEKSKPKSYEGGGDTSKNLMAAATAGTTGAGISEDEIMKTHRPSDFAEMEAWLEANPQPQATSASTAAGTEKSLTSSEFDRFLQERAGRDSKTTTSRENSKDSNDAKEKLENKMFGL